MNRITFSLAVLLAIVYTIVPASLSAHSGHAHIFVTQEDGTTTVTARVRTKPAVPIKVDPEKWVKFSDTVDIQDVRLGNGKDPVPDWVLHVHLRSFDADNQVVDDTLFSRTILRYAYKQGLMPKEFDEAIATLKEGGKRVVRFKAPIEYNLGFIPAYQDALPRRQAYWFEVSLLRVEDLRDAVKPSFK